MRRGLLLAWALGEGLMVYRIVQREHRPPFPGELLATSGLFVMLALLGEATPGLAATLAWGFDAAAYLNLFSKTPANQYFGGVLPPPEKGL